jgi:hypothetical protein
VEIPVTLLHRILDGCCPALAAELNLYMIYDLRRIVLSTRT